MLAGWVAGGKGPLLPSPSLAPGWGAFILLGQPFVSRSQRVHQTLASFLSLKGWARPFHSKQWWFWEVPFLSGCWGGVERQTTVALVHRNGAGSLQWEISYWLFQPSHEVHYSLSPTLNDCYLHTASGIELKIASEEESILGPCPLCLTGSPVLLSLSFSSCRFSSIATFSSIFMWTLSTTTILFLSCEKITIQCTVKGSTFFILGVCSTFLGSVHLNAGIGIGSLLSIYSMADLVLLHSELFLQPQWTAWKLHAIPKPYHPA